MAAAATSHFFDFMACPDWIPGNCSATVFRVTPRSLAMKSMKSMSKPTILPDPVPSSTSNGAYGSDVQTVSEPPSTSVALAAEISSAVSAAGAAPDAGAAPEEAAPDAGADEAAPEAGADDAAPPEAAAEDAGAAAEDDDELDELLLELEPQALTTSAPAATTANSIARVVRV
jgi:hypothetical protein